LGLFLLSGATSLVYQILWVRELSLSLGSTVYAISIVVSAFMAGLAIGSAYFGGRVDRWGSPLRLYAILEGGIGICALLAPLAFQAIAQAAAASPDALVPSPATKWLPFVASFVVLLVPTTLMGGTLPILSRYVASFRGSRGALIGALYSFNTIGAIVGTALTGFVLIRLLGIRSATHLAAAGNMLILVIALILARIWPGDRVTEASEEEPAIEAEPARLLGAVTLVYFVNGLAGLAFELLWTRAIVLFTTNTIYAFTVILTTFLLGLGIGSSAMSTFVSRIRRPHALLGGLQCLIAIMAAITPFVLSRIGLGLFRWAEDAARPLGLAGEVVSAYAVAVLFMLPATLLMGASFPLVARIVAGATDRVGRAVGRVYALNTVGAVLGSLLSAFVLLPAIGVERSILVFALVCAASGLYLLIRVRARTWTGIGLVGVVVVIVLVALTPNHFRQMLEKSLDKELLFYREGIEATVGAYDSERAARPVLVINSTALDDRGVVHQLLAHLPALFHPDPKRALVLGFGVGISSEAFSAHGIETNDCVEISPAVLDAAPYFAEINGDIASRGDPNFTVYETDGRKLLLGNARPYDIIVLDANSGNLRNAGVGKLYTRDFFELCRSRLSPDGMVTLYVSPNGSLSEFKMVARTFMEVFPHTTLWIDRVFGQTSVLLGSQQPLSIDLDRYLERIDRPAVREDLALFDLDPPGALLSCFLMGEEVLSLFCADGDLNTDNHPVMEFYPLGMDVFAADDRPLSDSGFLLFRESLVDRLPLVSASDVAKQLHDYLASGDRATSALLESWIHGWFGNREHARSALNVAAAMHPESEALRSRMRYGRRHLEEARSAADTVASYENLARLSLIEMRRGLYDQAAVHFRRAIDTLEDQPTADPTVAPAALYAGAARCARELGRLGQAKEYLDLAERVGADVTVERLEVELVDAAGDSARTVALLKEMLTASMKRVDIVKMRELLDSLNQRGASEAPLRLMEARCLEALGDVAGAYLVYEDVLASAPASDEARHARDRCAVELAARADVFRDAYGTRATGFIPSTFAGGRVSYHDLPVRQHDDPALWMELSQRYVQARRPVLAYRKARAARTFAPMNPDVYVAVGRAAAGVGNADVARTAFTRALKLDGSLQAARLALQQLGP